ncbi:MAG: hypothetical protein J4G05_04370 [Chlorobi bacterium]|nr:hypothetical protein [Chlorobiota bacterium]
MKKIKFFLLLPVIVVGLPLFQGCEEDTTQPPEESDDHTEILFIHAAPAAAGVDLLIDDYDCRHQRNI